jgi:hypothetical protein
MSATDGCCSHVALGMMASVHRKNEPSGRCLADTKAPVAVPSAHLEPVVGQLKIDHVLGGS